MLLDVLTDQFIAHAFDIKWMLGQLARSKTYQRSSLLPQDTKAPEERLFLVGLEKPIDAVERLIPRLPAEARRSFSFTTGLSPAVRRPFQAHFLPDSDATRERTLKSQNIVRVVAK
jgi:hypothetical protein